MSEILPPQISFTLSNTPSPAPHAVLGNSPVSRLFYPLLHTLPLAFSFTSSHSSQKSCSLLQVWGRLVLDAVVVERDSTVHVSMQSKTVLCASKHMLSGRVVFHARVCGAAVVCSRVSAGAVWCGWCLMSTRRCFLSSADSSSPSCEWQVCVLVCMRRLDGRLSIGYAQWSVEERVEWRLRRQATCWRRALMFVRLEEGGCLRAWGVS